MIYYLSGMKPQNTKDMYRYLRLLVLPAFLLLISCISGNDSDDGTINHVTVGSAVPEFTVLDEDGGRVDFTLSSFTGKRTLLTFFAYYCDDCKREMPKIHDAWKALKDEPDFQVINIERQATAEQVVKYWSDSGFSPMPWYRDIERAAFYTFANQKVPRAYIIDATGVVRWMAVEYFKEGGKSITAEQIIEKLEQLKPVK